MILHGNTELEWTRFEDSVDLGWGWVGTEEVPSSSTSSPFESDLHTLHTGGRDCCHLVDRRSEFGMDHSYPTSIFGDPVIESNDRISFFHASTENRAFSFDPLPLLDDDLLSGECSLLSFRSDALSDRSDLPSDLLAEVSLKDPIQFCGNKRDAANMEVSQLKTYSEEDGAGASSEPPLKKKNCSNRTPSAIFTFTSEEHAVSSFDFSKASLLAIDPKLSRPGCDSKVEIANSEENVLGKINVGRWTVIERQKLEEGLRIFGVGKWKQIANYIGTRNRYQVSSHYQKFATRIDVQGRSGNPKHSDLALSHSCDPESE